MSSSNDSGAPRRSGPVLGAERQRSILAAIDRGGIVSVGEFAERFGVSHETIRRDIRGLEEAGRLRRIHGGAAPASGFDLTARRPVSERLSVDRDAKLRAAVAAMALFEDDMNVYLGASSTMLLVAEELARRNRALAITTNMIDIAVAFAGAERCSVTLLGGQVSPRTRSTGGVELMKALEHRLFDLSVMGASAVHPQFGVLGPTSAHAMLAAVLCAHSTRHCFVAHSAKFGRRDAQVVRPLRQIDMIATDRRPPDALAAPFETTGAVLLLPDQAALARPSSLPPEDLR
ncbi:DeoR/GlpR family DNA-binding transcription regulator [Propylenella binzhouense]|uniref:DeoR/GlpR transcriptional regulator n=1 Tax=Propylenella binzhouense TaxID=2555902 RepID=A0A964WS32_9HYPH|nr:DeoR/GlpR family DNA-binding transcription regulator [Propylenella binzhouense]MYZ46537.1 DeoR/GlpR transcriptional regulator [Propylenella binzhouense]